MKVSASLVLYNNSFYHYKRAINSYLKSCNGLLYIVDNASSFLDDETFNHPRIKFLYTGSNVGFGAAHNLALKHFKYKSNIHIILNPDVYFHKSVIPNLINILRKNSDIGAIAPKVNFPNGKEQLLYRKLPKPWILFLRWLLRGNIFLLNFVNKGYVIKFSTPHSYEVPLLSGCFFIARTIYLKKLGGFDEKFFLYLEDYDLIRRLGEFSKIVLVRKYNICHFHSQSSYKNLNLFLVHIKSGIYYFNKWGWFLDQKRGNADFNCHKKINI